MAKNTIIDTLKSKTAKVLKNIIQFVEKSPFLSFCCGLIGGDIYQLVKSLLFS